MPGIPQLVAASIGGLSLAVGMVLLLSGALLGLAIVVAGAALVVWSVVRPRA
jgi:hypothetical protein